MGWRLRGEWRFRLAWLGVVGGVLLGFGGGGGCNNAHGKRMMRVEKWIEKGCLLST